MLLSYIQNTVSCHFQLIKLQRIIDAGQGQMHGSPYLQHGVANRGSPDARHARERPSTHTLQNSVGGLTWHAHKCITRTWPQTSSAQTSNSTCSPDAHTLTSTSRQEDLTMPSGVVWTFLDTAATLMRHARLSVPSSRLAHEQNATLHLCAYSCQS